MVDSEVWVVMDLELVWAVQLAMADLAGLWVDLATEVLALLEDLEGLLGASEVD
jgi:uncharacterized membrane protein